jgi:adenylate kinase family enzyme
VLTARDPLPARPHRVVVAGVSGSGKSTLARRLAALLGAPYHELDALHHGPGWVKRADFETDVAAFVAGAAWVCEWQYDTVRGQLAERADLMVWLDLPFRVTLGRVVRRTLVRRVRRQELWNGNREAPLRTFLTDPEHVVRWSIRTRHLLDTRVPAAAAEHSHLVVVRLRTRREVDRWLRTAVAAVA